MKRYINNLIFVFILTTPLGVLSLLGQDLGSNTTELSTEQIEAFKTQAMTSITDLNRHMEIIANRKNELDRRNKAIDLAVKLFNSENNIFQVNSIKHPEPHDYKIREYFNKIKGLPYSSVKITWYNIYFSTDIRKGPDGRYYGVATVFQKFEGTSNEFKNYTDITKKSIQVIVYQEEAYNGSDKINRWVLRLGDVKLEEMKNE